VRDSESAIPHCYTSRNAFRGMPASTVLLHYSMQNLAIARPARRPEKWRRLREPGLLEYSRGPGARRYRGEHRDGWPRPPRARRFFGAIKGRPRWAARMGLGEKLADGLGLEIQIQLCAVLE